MFIPVQHARHECHLLSLSLQSGVGSVGGAAGGFSLPSMPSMPSLPGSGKDLSLADILVLSLFTCSRARYSYAVPRQGKKRSRLSRKPVRLVSLLALHLIATFSVCFFDTVALASRVLLRPEGKIS